MAAVVHTLAGLALAAGIAQAAAQGAASPAQIKAGDAVYARCAACHSLSHDRTGPRHCGLLGRRAGSIKGFSYSDAMKRVDFVWDEKTLDRFLADPEKTVPGTSMGYAGIKDKQERADLIAYLRQANESPECKR